MFLRIKIFPWPQCKNCFKGKISLQKHPRAVLNDLRHPNTTLEVCYVCRQTMVYSVTGIGRKYLHSSGGKKATDKTEQIYRYSEYIWSIVLIYISFSNIRNMVSNISRDSRDLGSVWSSLLTYLEFGKWNVTLPLENIAEQIENTTKTQENSKAVEAVDNKPSFHIEGKRKCI